MTNLDEFYKFITGVERLAAKNEKHYFSIKELYKKAF